MKKSLALLMLGAVLEYYDFAIFIYFANSIGNSLIALHDPIANLMASFGVFAIAALFRPLGGILFAHFGDTRGRKTSFVYSILLMAIPTFLIGLIPDQQQIGGSAAILLLALRCIQGLAIGGEVPGSIVFAYELSQSKNKALNTNLVVAGTNIGLFMASYLAATLLEQSTYCGIAAWRIAFFLGGGFGIISYFLRKRLRETPEFSHYKHFVAHQPRIPIAKLLREHKLQLLQIIAFGSYLASSLAVFSFFMPAYLTTYFQLALTEILKYNAYSILIFICSAIIAGKFDYLFGRKFLAISTLIFVAVNFYLFSHYNFLSLQQIAIIHSWVLFYIGLICGRLPVLAASFFPVQIRYSGVALSYNICFGVVAGLTQLILFTLIRLTGLLWLPAAYIALFAVATLFFLITTPANKFTEYS